MGLRDFILGVVPGQGPAAAAVQREKREARGRQQAARAQQDNRDRSRRHKRGRFEPPAPGINP